MSEYISVGDLALDLRTSKQKLGRLNGSSILMRRRCIKCYQDRSKMKF